MTLDFVALKELGKAHLAAHRYEAASEVLEEAAHLTEVPRGGLCVRLARAHLEANRPGAAAAWLMPVVDTAPSFKTWAAAARLLGRCPPATWPLVRRHLKVGLVGTWTTTPFAPLLKLAGARLGLDLEVRQPDFGQYFNATLDPGSPLYAGGLDALILAPDHHSLGVKPFTSTPEADAEAEIARWSGVWRAAREAAAPIIVQHGFAMPGLDPLGHLAEGLDGTRRSVVQHINRGLAHLAAANDVGFINVWSLAARLGTRNWFDDRGWYMAKTPFAADALPLLARHTAAVLAARMGLSRRCVVLDLDNTLWGGVIGDDGVEGITLGGSVAGEAYVDFQVALKELASRGIVLAVCSKNDPEVAREPFRSHPEMVLREEDVAVFVATWGAKSEGIREIAARLGLGLDSLTFLDDNPYERAEVRRALPDVDVPLLPDDPTGFRRALEEYPYFEPATFTDADRERGRQYRARASAIELRATAGSLQEYQASLGMRAEFGTIDSVNKARVVQLLNKTNQFNLTTQRRNQAELDAFLARPGAIGFYVRLVDRFADHGLIAVALAVPDGGRLGIDTLLMSCRVLGRGVETVILSELGRLAAEAGHSGLVGWYRPSDRNGLVADLYPRHGFAQDAISEDGRVSFLADATNLTASHLPIHLRWVNG